MTQAKVQAYADNNGVQPDHYFATCAFGWKVADTRDKAIRGLIEGFRGEAKRTTANLHKQGEMGMYIWSTRVEIPLDQKYEISYYQPKGVPISDSREHCVTYVSAKHVAWATTKVHDNTANARAQAERSNA